MSGGGDHDKTVFGGGLPPAAPQSESPFERREAGAGGDAGGAVPAGDRTVIGGLPPGAGPAPWQGGYGQPSGHGHGQSGDGWIGTGMPQFQPGQAVPGGASHGGGIGRPASQDGGFFPDYHRAAAAPGLAAHLPKIPLDIALRVSDIGAGSSSNPLLAAAANLLILLGRLRTGMVDLQVAPLMEHVTLEIDRFERGALAAGVDPHEALVAKYALSGTADDIVQNLPGSDRGNWQQYSMVARFFHKRDSGVGFFQEAEKAMRAPAQRYQLLELMLVCLSLGFEGQFRTAPNGAVELARIRKAIHETLRRIHPRPDDDISVMWAPVVQDKGRRFAAIPLPVVFGAAALVTVACFAALTTLINRDAAQASETLLTLHGGAPVISIQRSAEDVYIAPAPAQLDRIREALGDEIAEGAVGVEARGDYIAIRVGNLQLFDLGRVEVREGFVPLAARIAEVLNAEGGPVLVQGFTDSLPLSGRGRFKDNYQLSEARAQAVADVLAQGIDDPSRLQVEGRGEEGPVGDNATEEGRAQNRRVEIMLAREGTYDAAPQQSPAAQEVSD